MIFDDGIFGINILKHEKYLFPLQKTEYDLKHFANFTSCSVKKKQSTHKVSSKSVQYLC